jgi:hypothetical protein
MENYKCEKCNLNLFLCLKLKSKYNSSKHIILCKKCKKETETFNRTYCLETLLIPSIELNNIKYILCSSNKKLYTNIDITNYINNKYGDMIVFNKINNKKKEVKKKKREKKEEAKEERRRRVKIEFQLNKLEYKEYGDVFLYIEYGNIELESIIEKEIKKQNDKSNKRYELLEELDKRNIEYEDNNNIINEYINNNNSYSIKQVISEIEIDSYLYKNTKYREYKKKYNIEVAREYALREYIKRLEVEEGKEIIDKVIKKENEEIIVFFE